MPTDEQVYLLAYKRRIKALMVELEQAKREIKALHGELTIERAKALTGPQAEVLTTEVVKKARGRKKEDTE